MIKYCVVNRKFAKKIKKIVFFLTFLFLYDKNKYKDKYMEEIV